MRKQLLAAAGLLFLLGACGQTTSRGRRASHILVAGSSTVYPFSPAPSPSTSRARTASSSPPVVQSTGTGAGFSLFCAGLGGNHPDVVGASRRMHACGDAAMPRQRHRRTSPNSRSASTASPSSTARPRRDQSDPAPDLRSACRPRLMASPTPRVGGTRSIPTCRTFRSSSTARRRAAAPAIRCAIDPRAGLRPAAHMRRADGGRASALSISSARPSAPTASM